MSCSTQNVFSLWKDCVRGLFVAHSRPKTRGTTRFRFYSVWHKRVRMQEAVLAKEKMHGRLACGRPLVVRLAGERDALEVADSSTTKAVGVGHKLHLTGGGMGQTSRGAKIAAIKNKLKSLEEDNSRNKKQKQTDNIP